MFLTLPPAFSGCPAAASASPCKDEMVKSCVALSACYCGVSPQTLRMLMPLEHTWPHRSQLASSVLSDGRITAAAQEFSQCQVCVAYKLLQK